MCRCDEPVTQDIRKMDFEFKGLTLWLEFDDDDAADSIKRLSSAKRVEAIPAPHVTLVYGMVGLCADEAAADLNRLASIIREEGILPRLEGAKPFFGQAWDGVDGECMVRAPRTPCWSPRQLKPPEPSPPTRL